MNDTCPNCKDYAHHNVELEEEIKRIKKQIDDKIQEAFTSRETGPWEKLREIRKILYSQEEEQVPKNNTIEEKIDRLSAIAKELFEGKE